MTLLDAERLIEAIKNEIVQLRKERDDAVRTARAWHRVALEIRDMSIVGKGDIDEHYMNAAMSLPFYGAVGEPIGRTDAVPG